MPSPLVSVVIPAYNSARTLGRAVESAIAQDWPAREVMVVDDASGDDTPRIAEAYRTRGVRLIRLERNGGASRARNAGIEAARGEWVAFLDADDEWLPEKLSRQVAVGERDERIVLVSCRSRAIGPDGVDRGDLYGGNLPATGADAWKTLLRYSFIATPSVLARRSALAAVGGFDLALPRGEDQDLWIRLAVTGHVGFVDAPLVRVHLSAASLSSDFGDNFRFVLPMVRRQLRAQRARLDDGEAREILGDRMSRLGRAATWCGRYRDAARLLGHATLLGYRPVENLLFLLYRPPLHWLNRRVRALRRAR